MSLNNERVCFYNLLLRTDLIEFSEYENWLNDEFAKDINNQIELLLELQFATNSRDKTISLLDEYLFSIRASLDFNLLGKMIIEQIEKIYMCRKFSVENLAHKIYGLWNYIPDHIGCQEPFYTMSYIDDPISYGDRAQTIDLIERLIDYYK